MVIGHGRLLQDMRCQLYLNYLVCMAFLSVGLSGYVFNINIVTGNLVWPGLFLLKRHSQFILPVKPPGNLFLK